MNQALPRAILIDEPAPPMSGGPPENSGFGFQDLLSVILSQRLLILAIIVLTTAAGAVFAYRQAPQYLAEAQVALGQRAGEQSNSRTSPVGDVVAPDDTLVESEIEILRSNDMMNRLIERLGAAQTAKLMGLDNPEAFATAELGSAERRDLVVELLARLSVQRQATSNVIAMGFKAPSPDSTVTLSNGLMQSYLESKKDERTAAANRAREWLDQRVEQLAKEVATKEAAVAAYRADMKLISVEGATLTEQQYYKLQGEVVSARADLAERQARYSKVEQIAADGTNGQAVLEAVNSPTIQGLRQKEAEVAGRKAELAKRYDSNHPSLQQVNREHEQVLQQISEEIDRIKFTLKNEVEIARSRLRELETGLGQLEGGLVEGNRAIVQLRELERDAETSSSVYRDYLLRAREIAEQSSLAVVDARTVSQALPPQRAVTTSTLIWVAFFFAAGILLAFAVAMLRSAITDRIVRPESIPKKLGVPSLVSVPLISRRHLRRLSPDERTPEDYLINQPMTAFAESLRVLTASLLSELDTGGAVAVAVTSALAAEGKTTVSLSMGRAAAMTGLRVLIIDCDARRPSLSASMGDRPALSLTDVIRNNASWREAAILDPLTAATVLPINPDIIQMQSMFRPEAVRKLLASVRSEFDLIIMDCPPVLAVAETRWITSVADASVIITHWNRTRSAAVKTAIREVMRAKGRVAGVVLNRMDVSVTRQFSFSDSLYYGGAGKGYYTA